ncbi:MAG: ATP-binding protein [Alphaproteobacteria bacterium]
MPMDIQEHAVRPDDTFRRLFQEMRVPRFIVRPQDSDSYIIIEANDLALQYFDLGKGQVIGSKIQAVMDHENALHFQQSFEVCTARGKSVTIQALPGVPGKIRVYGFYISPVCDSTGAVEYLDVIGQLDLTDQSILQRERDDAISLMTSIFDVSEVGIIVTDHSGRIVRVNDSFVRIYGWSRDELINAEISGLVTPDERVRVKKNYEEFIKTGVRSSAEMKIIRKNGSIANALYTTATMELSQKRRFQVTTLMDITLRKQMEESLRLAKDEADAANRAKSTFLANMSHELRTPLNAIIGFSEMMLKETFGPLGHGKYAEYMTDIHGSAFHLLEIINEVLDMSKIEAGRIELDEEEVELRELIESVTRMMASKIFGDDLKIRVEIHDNLPNIRGDKRLLRQVLINLVTNAVKFSESGGEINIQARLAENRQIRIVISDQGVGIPKDKIQTAMQPFGQVNDKAEHCKQQGTGLGLPLAKAMIELHGGTLTLESDTGQGTVVFITLPASRILPRIAENSPSVPKGAEHIEGANHSEDENSSLAPQKKTL